MKVNKIDGSSNIDEVAYDNFTMYLFVKFNSGATYRYEDVPRQVFDRLMESDSKGTFLNINIKKNYAFEKLDDDFEFPKPIRGLMEAFSKMKPDPRWAW